MFKLVYYSAQDEIKYDISLSQVSDILQSGNGLLWLVLQDANEDELNSILHDIFHFHPLTIEDCLSEGYQTPKLDVFENYIFVVMHALIPDRINFEELKTGELDLFLGRNFVVCSTRESELPPVTQVWERQLKDDRLLSHGSDFLFHAILDTLVDDYLPILDRMDEEIEKLEDRVLEKPNPETLQRIISLKHAMLTLRRITSPQREIMNKLSRDSFDFITEKYQIYFRDIYDHLVRIQDLAETIRDIVSGTLDIYLSSTSNRLNEVMKALTIVSTIFLPLSFIAGVYGMNFKYFPEINWVNGYLFVWILFLTIFGLMIWYFKKRNWF